jgi:hypothetical protein
MSRRPWTGAPGVPRSLGGVPEQDAVLEPGGVPPVVGGQPGERHPERGTSYPGVRLVAGGERDVDVLPGAPVPGCPLPDRGIRVGRQPAVRLGQAAVALGGRDAIAEAHPLLGEHAAHLRVSQSTSRAVVVATLNRTCSETRSVCASA